MTELKKSKLLLKLLEDSKKIGNISNPPLTAERFLVAVADMAEELDKKNDIEAEMVVLYSTLKSLIKDTGEFKRLLMAYICSDKDTLFIDDLYMKKKIHEATEISIAIKAEELDSLALTLCIFDDPSEAINEAVARTIRRSTASVQNPFAQSFGDTIKENLDATIGFTQEPVSDDKSNDAKPFGIENCDLVLDDDCEETPEDGANNAKSEMNVMIADVKRVREYLRSYIFGQDNAINVFTTGYFQGNMMSMVDKTQKRPRATFLFAGPPGVGKTFLAEKAAEALKLPFRRFDMSEYSDKEANLEFCGSDKVYKNAKAGNVTSFVAQNPKCVLLFDEIEKAHINVIHLFLQMLDAGRVRDNFTDEEVSFSDTIIILTTNAGRPLYEESESGDFSAVSRKVIMKALQKDINPDTNLPFFPGALCSRFASGNVVMFNHIGAHNLHAIAKSGINILANNFENETGIKIQIDERVFSALMFSEGGAADARTIKSRAATFFNDELHELLRLIASEKVKTGIENLEKISIGVDFNRTKDEVLSLFASPEKIKALVFADEDVVAFCTEKVKDLEFIGVQNVEDAVEALKANDIKFVLLDVNYGVLEDSCEKLNIEDVESLARDFFRFLKEQRRDLPVYLLETQGKSMSEEEKISFMRQGVREVLGVTKSGNDFADQINLISLKLYQQASMIRLAKENKLVSFETAQTVSGNGKNAEIKLFDFEMAVAIEGEDSKNVLSSVSSPDICFDDVIGAEDAKAELKYFVEYLKDPKKYMGTGVKAPKGVILYGPPGTGKTMLAKAMASEANVTFIATEGNSFLKKYVGEGPEKVHELFNTARKYAPSVLFIDEIDAIAKERGGENSAGVDATLTAFLTEMDGFVNNTTKPVFVLAATNFDVKPGSEKSLDSALMRRFDRRVYIDLPNKADRIRFLNKKIEKNRALKISADQVDNIAMRATGMSLAEMDSVVELALRSAIRSGSTVVDDAIFEEAFETFNGGDVKKWDESQLERVARHEAGHALLCWLSGEKPSYLTIVARGNHGGYMQRAEQEGKAIYTKDELLARIRTSLGGRAAEIAYYGEKDGISTGASGDLTSATSVAQQIVCTYGMDEAFGIAVVHGAEMKSGAMSAEVRNAVNKILKAQMDEAVKLVSENKDRIDSLVNELMLKNHLNGTEIDAVLSKSGL